MAYDEGLADRVRGVLEGRPGVTEQPTADGLGFLQDGNLAVRVRGADLLVRVGAGSADAALARPGAARFFDEGRELRGWVVVAAEVLVDDVALYDWVDEGHAFAAGLPPK